MTTDLSATSSEVVETNSLREVSLFCAVLLVEIYSLSVAFGGPFFEVGYFLLVVISQTFAGAYIWAQLRQSDKILPLPELLAMGFAIGSASAAISQLIIRDLLGIRLFLSPLVPIIGVATWLFTRRDPQLPVKVTHATTNTLLWLLFPAPLALSFFIWQLLLFFVLPMILVATLIYKSKSRGYLVTLFLIAALAAVFGEFTRRFQQISTAISLVGFDEIFDEAHAIGFSNWGIGENISRSGEPFAYYKLSHIWLGPILELTHAPPIIISTSVMLISVFTVIGLALWTITFQIHKSSLAAGIGAVLIFVQHSFPEPHNLPIRIAQCLVIVYLITGLTAISKSWNNTLLNSLVMSIVVFVTFSTRAQYGLIIFVAILFSKFVALIRRKSTMRQTITELVPSCLAVVMFFYIFLNHPGHAVVLPNSASLLGLGRLLVGYSGVRALIPLFTSHRYSSDNQRLLLNVIFSAGLLYFVIPQSALSGSPEWTIAVISTILISREVVYLTRTQSKGLLFGVFVLTFVAGILIRLSYDLYIWKDINNLNSLLGVLARYSTSGANIAFQTTLPFLLCIAIVFFVVKIRKISIRFQSVVILAALSMSFGVSIATTSRTLTRYFRYDQDIRGVIDDDTPMSWYTQSDRIIAIRWLRENSRIDDIFAHNTLVPNYQQTSYSASLILGDVTHRRAYTEATYGENLQKAYPKIKFRQSQNLREDLQRLDTSYFFPIDPSWFWLKNLQKVNVKWFVVDLTNTPLRDWEPWATTRFMNEKVAILELAQAPVPSN